MAIGDISVNTTTIKSIAESIRNDAKDYGAAMETLFSTVDALKSTWTSEDGNAYIAKINTFREEFEIMKTKLDKSAEAFELVAANYKGTVKANIVT